MPPPPLPPPSPSQSHFAKFENFTPDENASFDDEFGRLASSQQWVPGSQEYTRERTIAMREEIKMHYFTQPSQSQEGDCDRDNGHGGPPRELTYHEKLMGYQELCATKGKTINMEEAKKNGGILASLLQRLPRRGERRGRRDMKRDYERKVGTRVVSGGLVREVG